MVGGGVTGMQKEIMDRGPIVACFEIYEDFYHYTGGKHWITAMSITILPPDPDQLQFFQASIIT